jgi:plasmid stabilization system protein ParE
MTSYSVVFTEQAAQELQEAAEWWAEHRSFEQAARWYGGFSAKIESLCESPERCPLADENHAFPYEIRELHYGLSARPTHRAIYAIVSDFVVILTVRHAARRALRPDDIKTDPTSL